jgi:hypothetical protein
MGFAELLALLMTLAGFGVDQNPNAPTGKQVLHYAPARADYMLHVDLVGVVPNNYDLLTKLPDHPTVKKEAKARDAIAQLVGQAEAGRSMIKGMIGLDPITDITSVTAWINVPDAGDPNVLVVVRGNIPADLIDNIAGASGMPTTEVKGVATLSPEPEMLCAVGPRGEVLFGTKAWVEPRLSKSWKRERAGAIAKGAEALLDKKPTVLLASGPSKRWVRKVSRELANEPEAALLVDLATGHSFLAVSILHNGVEWTTTARTKSGYARAVRASDGAVELMRSFHHASRGVARVLLAAIPSYKGTNEVVDAIVAHADEIMKLVENTTGDGTFKVERDASAGKRTVHITATGDDLSDVLPAAGVVPVLGAAGFFLVASEKKAMDMDMPAAAAP